MGTQNQTTTQLRGTQILDKSITQNDITLSGITKTNVINQVCNIYLTIIILAH